MPLNNRNQTKSKITYLFSCTQQSSGESITCSPDDQQRQTQCGDFFYVIIILLHSKNIAM